MNPLLITAAIAAALGFGGAWQVQSWRMDAKELENANERISQQRAARATIERTTSAVMAAQNAATTRSVGLRHDAAAAATELDRLRSQSADSLRASAASFDSCLVRATAFSELLNQCGTDLTGLSAKADRHTNDLKTLTEAWPK